jgi:hypothetical protein
MLFFERKVKSKTKIFKKEKRGVKHILTGILNFFKSANPAILILLKGKKIKKAKKREWTLEREREE